MDSVKTGLYLCTVLMIICHLGIIICEHTCQQKHTYPELNGYRCVTDSGVYTNITNVPQHICIYACMIRDDCYIVNYNIEQSTCHLSNDACGVLAADEAFQVNYLGNVQHSECLQWLPTTTSNNIGAVSNPSCYRFSTICDVGRMVASPNVLPGTYTRGLNQVWSVLHGNEISSGTGEILTVRAGCQVTWMPFSAGDTVPERGVEGGFLASSGAILYVMRAPADDYIKFGYYDPVAIIGYIPYIGIKTATEMEILVLL